MREKQLILIPKDSERKSKNILWSEALKWADTDNEGLKRIIDEGIEVKGFFIDEALTTYNKLD